VTDHGRGITRDAERLIGRLLIGLTYLSVALLVVGVVILLAAGTSPLSGGPGLDLAALSGQVATLSPDGFLWLGLLTVVAAPIGRVVLAAFAYARAGDRQMVLVAVAILGVIALGVVTAGAATV
jgi:uncharacterized membrane protein